MVAISAVYNGEEDSPGIDLTITGLEGFEQVTVTRTDLSNEYPVVSVRGLDSAEADPTMNLTDFEAPISKDLVYEVTGFTFEPDLAHIGTGAAHETAPSPNAALDDPGDTSILFFMAKPYTSVIGTPTGWTLLGSHTNGSVASGTDTGSVIISVFRREGVFSGAQTVPVSGHNVSQGVISSYRKADAGSWTYEYAEGGDSTDGANFSATGTTSLNPFAGDIIFAGIGVNSDAGTISAVLLAEPNAVLGSTTTRQYNDTTTGDDASIVLCDATVISETGSGAPVVTYTNASSTSGTAGFVCLSTDANTVQSAESSTVSIPYEDIGDTWIKSIFTPGLSKRLTLEDLSTTDYTTGILDEYKILDRKLPVIITDDWGARTIPLVILTDEELTFHTTWRELYLLMTEGGTLLFQTADTDHTGEPDMYCEVASMTRDRRGRINADGELIFAHRVVLKESDRPSTLEESLGLRSYQDVLEENADYQAIVDEYDDYLDLLVRPLT